MKKGACPLSFMKNLISLKPIAEVLFTFLDVETTGLSPVDSRIVEVAMMSFKGQTHIKDWTSLVNPEISISDDVSKIHGITNETVKSSPKFNEIAPKILDFIEDSVIVAHNADFDLGFLKMEFSNIGLKFPDTIVIDTLKIARRFGNFTNNKLGTIAMELNIYNGWHRAFNDVEMTRKIFEYFTTGFQKKGAVTLEDILKKIM
jgi:DNA polymerase III epsilon subunit family exonuclease